jgi:hypothetical protein
MTLSTFQQLSRDQQLHLTCTQATFLLRHWQAWGSVNIYHLTGNGPGLFVEIASFDAPGCPIAWVRTHTSISGLTEYVEAMPVLVEIS